MEQKHATTFTKPNTNALCCTCGQTLPPLHQIPSLSQKTAQLRRSHNRRLHPTLQRPLWVKSRMPQDSKGEKRRGERQGNLAHDVQANSGQSALVGVTGHDFRNLGTEVDEVQNFIKNS